MRLELIVSEEDSNAVLWYEVDNAGQGREAGKTITKTHFVHSRTTPSLTTYYHISPGLEEFVENQVVGGNVTRAVLYSTEGFEARRSVKKNAEYEIEAQACRLCLFTCGFAICLCGPCGWCDQTKTQLNEEYYCAQIKRNHPDKVDDNTKTDQFTADEEFKAY